MNKNTFVILLLLLILVTPLGFSEQIKIKKEDGIPVVYNPKKPAPPPGTKSKLVLEEELCIGDDEEEYLFSERSDFISTAIDNDWNIFTLDPKLVEIRKYDTEGKLITIFGKKGNGPEEMEYPQNMMITPQNELMFNDTGNSRLTFYSADGEYLRYIPTHKLRFGRLKIDSKGNLVADITRYTEDEDKKQKVFYEIKRFNQNLEPTFTYISVDVSDKFREQFEGRKYSFGPDAYWQITEDDHIILGDTRNYELYIISPTGKVIRRIKKEFDPAPVIEEDLDRLSERLKQVFKIEKHHKGFYYFTIDDEGRIFARTWERTDDKKGFFYDVFDSEGRYIAKIPIKAFIKRWIKGKLLTVEETDDGFPVVKRYNVIWK